MHVNEHGIMCVHLYQAILSVENQCVLFVEVEWESEREVCMLEAEVFGGLSNSNCSLCYVYICCGGIIMQDQSLLL